MFHQRRRGHENRSRRTPLRSSILFGCMGWVQRQIGQLSSACTVCATRADAAEDGTFPAVGAFSAVGPPVEVLMFSLSGEETSNPGGKLGRNRMFSNTFVVATRTPPAFPAVVPPDTAPADGTVAAEIAERRVCARLVDGRMAAIDRSDAMTFM
jgi:hypothetical protein